MRGDYIVYPETLEKLEKTGLAVKIDKLLKSKNHPYYAGHVYNDEIRGEINDMKKRGYFETFPKEEKALWQKKAQELFGNPENYFWEVNRKSGVVKEEAELEDLLLSIGIVASNILKPHEIWDYKKFGFSSITDFTGSVGALFMTKQKGGWREGYKWVKEVGGQVFKNEITGDMNCDFRLHQDDITPYKTLDPFGSEVGYRPQLDSDRGGVYGYHSCEAQLLVSILRWIEQKNINSELLKNNAKEILTWAKSLRQGGGTCAEHFGGFEQNPMLFFPCFELPVVKLNADNSTGNNTIDIVGTTGDGYYGMFVSSKNELVFSYENPKKKNILKKINAFFQPDEADHLIKGLFYQSAKGLGRTSVRQLIDILEYRYSPKFEEDNARFKKRD